MIGTEALALLPHLVQIIIIETLNGRHEQSRQSRPSGESARRTIRWTCFASRRIAVSAIARRGGEAEDNRIRSVLIYDTRAAVAIKSRIEEARILDSNLSTYFPFRTGDRTSMKHSFMIVFLRFLVSKNGQVLDFLNQYYHLTIDLVFCFVLNYKVCSFSFAGCDVILREQTRHSNLLTTDIHSFICVWVIWTRCVNIGVAICGVTMYPSTL